jgi:tartrate/fumarate subfamily iron-sulfur-dependent hydro-lyase beta chain
MLVKETHLRIPLKEEDVLDLELGDLVYFSGPLFSARTLFHVRAVRENILPSIDFTKLNVMVHMGPVMKKDGCSWIPLACDPTTSMRFEKYAADVISELRLRALIGKASMGPKTAEAMKKYGCVHLAKIGIYGNTLASKITKVLGVYFMEELGPIECTWVMEGKDFGPFFVDIDARGQNFFQNLKRETREKLISAYGRFAIPEDFRFSGD